MSKRLLSAALLGALLSTQVLAQSTVSTTVESYQPAMTAKGFKVALLKPVLRFRVEAKAGGNTESDSTSIGNSLGISVGYAHLPVQQIGFIGSFALIDMKEDGEKLSMWRVNGSAAYSLNSTVAFFGGMNISNITNNELDKYVDPSVGLQVGTTIQFNKNFGMDLGLTAMRQTGEITTLGTKVEIETSQAGPEISLHGTF